MHYLGGKSRLAAKFAPILRESLARTGGVFYEPFMGGFNIVPTIHDVITAGQCSDIHPGLYVLYESIRRGWIPPDHVSEYQYEEMRHNRRDDWQDPLTTFVAFGLSYGGKQWDGFATDYTGRGSYAIPAKNSLLRKSRFFDRIEFLQASYEEIWPLHGSTVYCDPPYQGTKKYVVNNGFDPGDFVQWTHLHADRGCEVFVSEFNRLSDRWLSVWSIERKTNTKLAGNTAVTDYLFRVV